MTRYTYYYWKHLPTGKTGSSEFKDWGEYNGVTIIDGTVSELDALRLINRWNQDGKQLWEYWL